MKKQTGVQASPASANKVCTPSVQQKTETL